LTSSQYIALIGFQYGATDLAISGVGDYESDVRGDGSGWVVSTWLGQAGVGTHQITWSGTGSDLAVIACPLTINLSAYDNFFATISTSTDPIVTTVTSPGVNSLSLIGGVGSGASNTNTFTHSTSDVRTSLAHFSIGDAVIDLADLQHTTTAATTVTMTRSGGTAGAALGVTNIL
jgi:hypothetical protein